MKVEVTGLDELMRMLETAPEALEEAVAQKAAELAEQVAGAARDRAPEDTGRLRNSIESFVERPTPGTVTGGARSSYPPAIYHEFGTGPVGSAHPHPKAGELGITHRPDGWVYWSEDVAQSREPDSSGEANGFVYTEGVPAKAFLYNAITALEEEILDGLGAVAEEALK